MGNKVQGNNELFWEKLLHVLDERMQFGLLSYVRRCSGYHFEGETLFIEPGSAQDAEYLSKDTVLQQLTVFASDIEIAQKVVIKK